MLSVQLLSFENAYIFITQTYITQTPIKIQNIKVTVKFLYAPSQLNPSSTHPWGNYHSELSVFLSLEFHINWNRRACILFCKASFTPDNVSEILLSCGMYWLFFFLLLTSIPFHGYTTVCLSVLLLMDTWSVFYFWLLWIKRLYTFYYILSHSFILGKHLRVKWLGHRVSMSLYL